MRLRADEWYLADKGKHFVLTEKGKSECASWRFKEIGKPIDEYGYEATGWAINEGYLVETDIPNWVKQTGYEVVYDYKGYTLKVGNPIVFHDLTLAENYKRHYESYSWMNHELYIRKATFEGVKPRECKLFNGKKVYNRDWWYTLDNFVIGDYVETEIVDEIINCLPPACMRSDCMQCGEPSSSRCDENGNFRTTYSTFKKIADGIWEYCGDCFRDENYRHGREIPQV